MEEKHPARTLLPVGLWVLQCVQLAVISPSLQDRTNVGDVTLSLGGAAGLQAALQEGTALPGHLPVMQEPHGEDPSVRRPWKCCWVAVCGQLQ